MSGPVWRQQPLPQAVSSDAAEWASGICDCCDDKRECTVIIIYYNTLGETRQTLDWGLEYGI